MTKYEWETELKKNIHRLQPEEIKRVLDYYGELFDDYAERGKRETEIINEFGNPVDVADKILDEYDSENAAAGAASTEIPVAACRVEKEDEKKTVSNDGNVGDRELSEKNAGTAPSRNEEKGVRLGRVIAFLILTVLTGGVFFILLGALWIVLGALLISGAAVCAGGVFGAIVAVGLTVTGKAGAGIAQLGIALAAIGLGIILFVLMLKLVKKYALFTKRTAVKLGRWVSAKKKRV